jgi:hypothetical protein
MKLFLYTLENLDNHKKYVGKSNLPTWLFKYLLYGALDDNKHYNDLLQKEWFENNFKLTIEERNDCANACDNIINEEGLLNPIHGYNVFNDLQNNKGRFKKQHFFNDDICLLFCFHPNVQFWARTLDIERNTISNRLSNFNLFNNGYFNRNIARYEDYYWTCIRIVYLTGECLTANQLMSKMDKNYKISNQLRITPRKISRFFSMHEVYKNGKKSAGCLLFCPKLDYDN